MNKEQKIERACEAFGALLREQLDRVDEMKRDDGWVDYAALPCVRIGICPGDGIGPEITASARRVLEVLLADVLAAGRAALTEIPGLTLERRLACGKAIPDDTLRALKNCHVILKGPTTTPQMGAGMANLESANVAMRRELDLFANIRPVRIPEEKIAWTIFRENTEGGYAVGSRGIDVSDDLAVDFTVTTRPGSERIARLAYDYARQNGFDHVSIVTKANVIKTTDGNFIRDCRRVSRAYPEIRTDEWYADIMTAKLIDKKRRRDFQILLLPNLYGDIISDEAAEFQGGVGTAGAANVGRRYAMFEAIHGSAPRMVEEGRAAYADPRSMLRAAAMLLSHIGFRERAERLETALDACGREGKLTVTGRADGATCRAYTDYVLSKLPQFIP